MATVCPLCAEDGGLVVWRDADWRVIRVTDTPAHPAFYRVVVNRHVREFSELTTPERRRCMDLVAAVEQALRDALQPTKVNLAALGNMVPHLHWHVIARFEHDSHFPQPIWGAVQRDPGDPVARLARPLAALDRRVAAAAAAA